MAPKRPHPLATSTLPSPSRRRSRPRPSYGNESDEGSDVDLASDDASSADEASPSAPAAVATSEDVLLLGSEEEESSPLTPVKVLERRVTETTEATAVAAAPPTSTTPAARRVKSRPRASSATTTTAGHRRSSPSMPTAAASASKPASRRVSSVAQVEPDVEAARTSSALVLPLPLVSYVLDQLLSSAVSPSAPLGSGRLTGVWSLVKHTLSPAGGGSTLSPREEVELRRLEGWIGLQVLRDQVGVRDRQGEADAAAGRELERGLAKAVGLCQKHSHLAHDYLSHLTVLQAALTALLDSPKLALKRLAKAAEHPALQFPAARYRLAFSTASLQLAYGKPRLALGTLADLRQTALNRSDWALAAAAGIGRLGICAKEGLWAECRELCAELEAEMSPVPPAATTADIGEGSTGDVFPIPSNPPPSGLPPSLAPQLRAHYLVTVVLALNHLGEGAQCATRVKELHALLDAEGEGGGGADGAMTGIGGGLLEVPFGSDGDSLLLAFTPPQTLYVLACLVTALAKRDPTGKRPKKRLFAEEGLRQLVQDDGGSTSPDAGVQDLVAAERERQVLKAELLCETAGVAVVRSEFGTASQILAKLTAHARQHGLFAAFAAQITLLQAYLAHATGQSASALDLYRAAAFLGASPSSLLSRSATPKISVDLVKAARLGEAGLLIGLGRTAEVSKETRTLARDAWGGPMPVGVAVAGTPSGRSKEANVGLRIAGGLVLGVLEDEILRSKQYMKSCLDLASGSLDNSAKPIILSLTAALFVNTREKQSIVMLETALQMARSLGPEGAGGNAALGAWLGEKYEAVVRKNGQADQADAMAKRNGSHRQRLSQTRTKAGGGAYQPWAAGHAAEH